MKIIIGVTGIIVLAMVGLVGTLGCVLLEHGMREGLGPSMPMRFKKNEKSKGKKGK